MAYEELGLQVYLWRQPNALGVFLCYKFYGLVPVGLHQGGSRLFNSDAEIDEALTDAHIAISIVGANEKSATVFGVSFWQLERLGLEPAKRER